MLHAAVPIVLHKAIIRNMSCVPGSEQYKELTSQDMKYEKSYA